MLKSFAKGHTIDRCPIVQEEFTLGNTSMIQIYHQMITTRFLRGRDRIARIGVDEESGPGSHMHRDSAQRCVQSRLVVVIYHHDLAYHSVFQHVDEASENVRDVVRDGDAICQNSPRPTINFAKLSLSLKGNSQ